MRRARRKEACVRVQTPLRDELAHYLTEQTGTLEGAATVKSDSAVDPSDILRRGKSINEWQSQESTPSQLPRTREFASPLEWQRKIPHTRNRGRVTANDNLRGLNERDSN